MIVVADEGAAEGAAEEDGIVVRGAVDEIDSSTESAHDATGTGSGAAINSDSWRNDGMAAST